MAGVAYNHRIKIQAIAGLHIDLAFYALALRATKTAIQVGPVTRWTTRLPSTERFPIQIKTPGGLSSILSSDDVAGREVPVGQRRIDGLSGAESVGRDRRTGG